jgi:hypothetical protein
VLIGDVNFPVRDEDRSIVADGSIAPGEMLFPNSSNDAEKNAPLEVVALEGFCKIMRTELLVHQLIPSPAMREALRPARADRRAVTLRVSCTQRSGCITAADSEPSDSESVARGSCFRVKFTKPVSVLAAGHRDPSLPGQVTVQRKDTAGSRCQRNCDIRVRHFDMSPSQAARRSHGHWTGRNRPGHWHPSTTRR